ncbi:MAG: peptidoglycan-binding protein LysM, partial [Flavobacteriales bacterium]|nr:peptidoglycan-binding protein LysM [Flavobacteriales bacterium]
MIKTNLKFLLIPLATILLSWGFLSKNTVDFSFYSTEGLKLYFDVPDDTGLFEEESDEFIIYPFLGKTYMGFREALAFKESRGDYSVINQLGYMGKYQFGRSTLRQIGIHDSELFLKDPILQESAFKVYTANNKWYLRNEIKRYSGKYVNGVLVT